MSNLTLATGTRPIDAADLPQDWKATQLKDFCTFIQGGRLGLTKQHNYRTSGVPAFSAAGQDGYVDVTEFRNTDAVVLSAIGANCGRCFVAAGDWTTLANVQVVVPDPKEAHARFLHYRVNRDDYWPKSGSAQPFVKPSDIRACWIALPPVAHQVTVIRVLDTLDTAINETEAIIAKLKAVKQGLLHDLLTRGIDANGELRPPQDEAPHLYKESPLGWIPKDWEASQLQSLTMLITSGSRGWAAYYSDDGQLFLRSQNIRMGFLDFTERQCVKPPPGGEGDRTKLEKLDLLITVTGNGVGNVAHIPVSWNETAYVSQHVGLVRFHAPSLALLAAHYFVEGAPGNRQIVSVQYGQSKPGLSLENLRTFWMPIPPKDEIALINDRIASIYGRLEKEEFLANQLRALKFGLQDDLLTGRVRVTSLLNTDNEKGAS